MITVSRSTLELNSDLVVMACAGEQRSRAEEREALNFSQSTSWKSGEGGEEVRAMGSLTMVIIGRWSASGGRRAALTSHEMMGSVSAWACQTLLGRVQFPE